jgi:hypothetical protein
MDGPTVWSIRVPWTFMNVVGWRYERLRDRDRGDPRCGIRAGFCTGGLAMALQLGARSWNETAADGSGRPVTNTVGIMHPSRNRCRRLYSGVRLTLLSRVI